MTGFATRAGLGARLGGAPMTWELLADALERSRSAYTVARVVAIAACELLETDRGAMFVRDADGDLKLLTATGFAYEPLAEYLSIRADSGLPVARVAREGRPLVFVDNRDYAVAYPELAAQRSVEGMQAEAVLPLRAGSATWGVAVFDWHLARPFPTAAHAELVRLSDLCAAALQRVAGSIPSLPG